MQVRMVVQKALRNLKFTQDIMESIGTGDNLDKLQANLDNLEAAKKKEERQKAKLLGKIMALNADDDLYDTLYDDLQGILHEHVKKITELNAQINKVNIAIQNASSKAITANEVYRIMRTAVELMDIMPAEDERKIMHMLLESVQVYPERQTNGLLVKKIRFKVPLEIDGVLTRGVILEADQGAENFLPNESSVETIVLLQRENS